LTVEWLFNYNILQAKQLSGCSTVELYAELLGVLKIEQRTKEYNMQKNRVEVCDCSVIHQNIVDEVKEKMPEETTLYDLADFFKVLGDSTRVRIMWALDTSEMCVCDLAVLLNMTKSAISHQLAELRRADLVRTRREGRNVYYSLADDHVRDVFEKGMEHILEQDNSL
jgi:DNA-binding transcriptional ArsR family regulator